MVLGHDIPSLVKKKPSEDIVALAFAFLCKDEKQTVDFLATNRYTSSLVPPLPFPPPPLCYSLLCLFKEQTLTKTYPLPYKDESL